MRARCLAFATVEASKGWDGAVDFDFEAECFFITPIGTEGSTERKRADGLLDAVVKPSADELGLTAIRADRIEEGGHITLQVLEHCANAKTAVADLTGRNLNVYYEVGIRHALRQPVVLLADESERGHLPFDLLQQRTIFYTNDMVGAAACRTSLTEQLRRALGGHVDSPVQAAANLHAFQQGDAVERTLAELITKVEELPAVLGREAGPAASIPSAVSEELMRAFQLLNDCAAEGDANCAQAAEWLTPIVGLALEGDPSYVWRAMFGSAPSDARARRAMARRVWLGAERLGDPSEDRDDAAQQGEVHPQNDE